MRRLPSINGILAFSSYVEQKVKKKPKTKQKKHENIVCNE